MTSREDLQLKGASRKLWLRVRDAFRRMTQDKPKQTRYRVTGGAVLGARWGHRECMNLHIRIDHDGTGTVDESLEQVAQEAGGRVDVHTFGVTRSIHFDDLDEEERVDAMTSGTMADIESTSIRLEGRVEPVATTAEIVYTKMAGRGASPPARDALDVAMTASKEPEALEQAVNALDEFQYHTVCTEYTRNAEILKRDARKLLGLNHEAKTLAEDVGEHARTAVIGARYQTFTIEVNGMERGAVVHTRSRMGETKTVWTKAEETAEILRKHWYDKAITATTRSARAVTREIESALKDDRKWSLAVVRERAETPQPAPQRPRRAATTPKLWPSRSEDRNR